jgi:hypothetical protein
MDVGKNYHKGRLATAALLFLAVLLTYGFAAPEQSHEAKVIFYVA